MNKKKIIFIAVGVLLVIWLVIGIVDFSRVNEFEKPIFCINIKPMDDGGSGHYIGFGYSFDIKGNFMPENELKGVTEYSYYIFGLRVQTEVRD